MLGVIRSFKDRETQRFFDGHRVKRFEGFAWGAGMSREPIHPGEILADELAELGISAADLARAIHVPANRVSQIIAGKRAITADTALRLGRWFGTGPQIWLNLQQAHDLDLVRQEMGSSLDEITPRSSAAR
jgi:addiction module HigA family antidote